MTYRKSECYKNKPSKWVSSPCHHDLPEPRNPHLPREPLNPPLPSIFLNLSSSSSCASSRVSNSLSNNGTVYASMMNGLYSSPRPAYAASTYSSLVRGTPSAFSASETLFIFAINFAAVEPSFLNIFNWVYNCLILDFSLASKYS
ncbi:hypothetical protein PIB30_048127 [Stylosanthes scabra]|uniref:Uncharacterized protein n=1 Tax=Stylosanthes scabra TaxID=79078 RepID=A0ABU6SGU9_9FABA|nr:hypothetical protein [Stylosanthes scabra]